MGRAADKTIRIGQNLVFALLDAAEALAPLLFELQQLEVMQVAEPAFLEGDVTTLNETFARLAKVAFADDGDRAGF